LVERFASIAMRICHCKHPLTIGFVEKIALAAVTLVCGQGLCDRYLCSENSIRRRRSKRMAEARILMTDLFKLILGILASRFKARATLDPKPPERSVSYSSSNLSKFRLSKRYSAIPSYVPSRCHMLARLPRQIWMPKVALPALT